MSLITFNAYTIEFNDDHAVATPAERSGEIYTGPTGVVFRKIAGPLFGDDLLRQHITDPAALDRHLQHTNDER